MKNMLKINNAHVVKQLYRHNKQKERPETEAPLAYCNATSQLVKN
jgi:RNA polymerase-interacting CarD/CdnL/TRCF family regulator